MRKPDASAQPFITAKWRATYPAALNRLAAKLEKTADVMPQDCFQGRPSCVPYAV